jgi:hypothetical protein
MYHQKTTYYIYDILAGVCCAIMSGILALSLWSYHPSDQSCLFVSSYACDSHNILGAVGSYIAGYALFLYEASAWILVAIGLYISYMLVRRSHKHYLMLCARAALSVILMLSVSIISAVHKLSGYDHLAPGGAWGQYAIYELYRLCDPFIAHIFVYMIFMISVTLLCPYLVYMCVYALYTSVYYLWSMVHIKKWTLFIHAHCVNIVHAFVQLCKRIFTEEYYINDDLLVEDVLKDPFWKQLNQSHAQSVNTDKVDYYRMDKEHLEPDKPEKTSSESSYSTPRISASAVGSDHARMVTEADKKDAFMLESTLDIFGIKGSVVHIFKGPVITLFQYKPEKGVKVSSVLARQDDLKLALKALSLRIIAPIPGTHFIGFEVAHTSRQDVLFNDLIDHESYESFEKDSKLPLVVGVDTKGSPVYIDLKKQPHMLIAGSTGSGKSVGLNALIMSILCTQKPDNVKMILIDPKRLEFVQYQDVAHLLTPVVTEPAQAVKILKWAVSEMESRYKQMALAEVKNIDEYHARYSMSDMPYIVVMIDELADLMMTGSKDIEMLIARLAQMARAAGIHLIVATQRPSVDVITGLIKVNFLSRISFKVTSKIDSRTILDTQGAEQLLGKGDMLFLNPQGSIERVHGCYVSEKDITHVVSYIKKQKTVEYHSLDISSDCQTEPFDQSVDDLYNDIITYIKDKKEISISSIQRVFKIGYNRSARIVEHLEMDGYVLPPDGGKMRKVSQRSSYIEK